MNIGYVNNEENLAGISLDITFRETGAFNPGNSEVLKKCMRTLNPGDTLYIESYDMLGTNFATLKNVIDTLANRDVIIKFHKEGVEFSKSENHDDTTRVFEFFRHAADFEKSVAQKKLENFKKPVGRPGMRTQIPDEILDKAIFEVSQGKFKAVVARELNVSRPTLNKLIELRKQELESLSG